MSPRQLTTVLLLLLGTSCAGATDEQLIKRASFDMHCPKAAISVVEIDGTTRGVRGCGQQGTYVEVCNGQKSGPSTECTWMLNAERKKKPRADE